MNTSSIRIIGGRHKSYRIVFKATPALRPTTDRAKETLFSWLQFELENKSCLDLFSGTGSLGLEALSRGAKHVTFVEKEKSLYKNILKILIVLVTEIVRKPLAVMLLNGYKQIKKSLILFF